MSELIYYTTLVLVALVSALILVAQYVRGTMLTPAERRIRKIRPETKARIEVAKTHPRETFDDVLTRLLDERESAQDALAGRQTAAS